MTYRPRHLSVSSVELYARCPAQWKRRYVDRVIDPPNRAMAWGSAFHKALEAVHTDPSPGGYELAWLRAWNSAQAAQGRDFFPNKAHGLELLDEFHARGFAVICPAEVRFSLPFPGGRIPVPLLGFIDATPADETREYKTTKGGWWNATRAQMSHQTHVYGWARQRLQHVRKPVRFVIFGTRMPTVTDYEAEPSPDGFRAFEQLAEMVWQGITEGRFVGCGECEICVPGMSKKEVAASANFDFDWDLD